MSINTTVETSMQQKLELDDQPCRIELLRLTLENFKGVKRFKLEPDGKDIAVLGDNAAGKTTLADAFSWLLFGKDSQGRADFELKTLTANGEALHGLEHSAEALLSIAGDSVELRKVYKEKWTKRRGSAEKEFTGHTRDHFFNGVPITQKEYESQVAELVTTEEVSKLLTNPIHFAERLHWQERRKKLLEVCGDISDDDVIASSPDLSNLSEILDGRSIDDHRKVAQAAKRKVNEELQRIPVRIDEVNRGLPDIEGNEKELQDVLDLSRNIRLTAEAERTRIQSGGEIAELTKRIREIESELIEERNRQMAAEGESLGELRRRQADIEAERRIAQDMILRGEQAIKRDEVEIAELEKKMEERREAWHELDAQKYEPQEGEAICAACGQSLPKEHVEEVRRKAEANFNAVKASRLSEIQDEGKRLKARDYEIKAGIQKQRGVIEEKKQERAVLAQKLEKLKTQIADREVTLPELSAKESELEAAKADLESEIAELRKGNEKALYAVEEKLESLNDEIIETESKLSRIDQRRKGEERIKQLKADERRLAGNYEELERGLYLMEEFTRQKVSLLTEQINSRFEMARFKLFDIQVNGGITETCQVSFEGRPWSALSTAEQINVGLDVIRTLSKHYGVMPCIWIDHTESVTELLDTPGQQQIRLVVSKPDKELRVEVLT